MRSVRFYLVAALAASLVVIVLAVVIRPYIEWLVLAIVLLAIAGMVARRN